MDISGRWEGYYDSKEFPVIVEFQQSGEEITGTMIDLKTEFEVPMEEKLLKGTFWHNPIRWVRNWFWVKKNPGIKVYAEWPPHSTIQGTLRGKAIRFRLVRPGSLRNWYTVGNQEVSSKWEDLTYAYNGQVLPSENEIKGCYEHILEEKQYNINQGSFFLKREDQSPSNDS